MYFYLLCLLFACGEDFYRPGISQTGTNLPVSVSIGLRVTIIPSGTSTVNYTEVLEGSGIYKVDATIAYAGMKDAKTIRQEFLVVDKRGNDKAEPLMVAENEGKLIIDKVKRVVVTQWSEEKEALALVEYRKSQENRLAQNR